MHPGIVSCPPDTDLTTVARMMATHRIHAVVVSGIESRDHGEHLTWGLLTSLDLVAAVSTTAVEAGEVSSSEVVTVEAGAPLDRAAQLMVAHHLTHLLVVSATDQPVGIVSTLDVVCSLARELVDDA